jgi:hypothetical protein
MKIQLYKSCSGNGEKSCEKQKKVLVFHGMLFVH